MRLRLSGQAFKMVSAANVLLESDICTPEEKMGSKKSAASPDRITGDSRSSASSISSASAKRAFTPFPAQITGLLLERLAQSLLYASDEKAEGAAAFLEKRPARFGKSMTGTAVSGRPGTAENGRKLAQSAAAPTTIARNTFREAIRDRILYNLVLFVLLLTGSAIVLGELTDGHEARTIINIGLNAMLLFGAFIAIFVGVGLVWKEIEKRTVYAIFAKPVRRSEFVVGKYLGLVLTLLVNVAIMGAGVSLALIYVGGGTLSGTVWGSIYLIFLELAILTAIAILFSSFSTPALSALLTFLIFLIGHLSSSLRELASAMESTATRVIFDGIYYVMPNLALFSFRTEAANGLVPNTEMILGGTAYAVIYSAVLLVIAIAIFSRRNFK